MAKKVFINKIKNSPLLDRISKIEALDKVYI